MNIPFAHDFFVSGLPKAQRCRAEARPTKPKTDVRPVYKARDTYRAIIERHGPVRPFVNIVGAEQTHIDALLPLYAKYGIPVPPEPDPARIVAPDSLLEACKQGVAAELENAARFDRLLAAVEQTDVGMVLERLQATSRDHHLPAFQRCVERGGATDGGVGGGKGSGTGGGRGQGRGRRGFGRGGH